MCLLRSPKVPVFDKTRLHGAVFPLFAESCPVILPRNTTGGEDVDQDYRQG